MFDRTNQTYFDSSHTLGEIKTNSYTLMCQTNETSFFSCLHN